MAGLEWGLMELEKREPHLHLPRSHGYVENTKAGKRPTTTSQVASQARGLPQRLPALYFLASRPHHVEALQFLTCRPQEVTCAFQAGELVSQSFGLNKVTCSLQQGSDYSGSTSEGG